jgi:hypothetical protein
MNKEEPKQETIEEAAKSNYDKKTVRLPVPTSHWINSEFLQVQNFIEGAKWQQEKMYSEKEVLQLLLRLQQTESYDNLYDWFKQFKKKNND